MSTSTGPPRTQRVVDDLLTAIGDAFEKDPAAFRWLQEADEDDLREFVAAFKGVFEESRDKALERHRLALDTWGREFEAASRTAIAMSRRRTRTPGRARPQARESHGTRRGHVRRQRVSAPSGDDPPAGSRPPRLPLAPKPGAVYTYGVQARERWGLE